MTSRSPSRRLAPVLALSAAAALLSACGTADRLASVGRVPELSAIQNPALAPGYQPVNMPMPAVDLGERQGNSLWRAGARSFFKDQRAGRVGDILTVTIQINDKAQMQNQTKRSRNGSDSMGIPNLFGLESSVNRVLPNSVDPSSLVSASGTSTTDGNGAIQRQEQINLQVAAIVTQIMPNGNLVVQGKQEVRVNGEVRELQLAGIIRPEDITSANTISYEKIAEARISYGGRGNISDVQQPRWGQQVLDIIAPF